MTSEPSAHQKPRETMGFERPLNLLWLALLFLATWALWSFRAASILLLLLIAATITGMLLRRRRRS